MKTIEKRKAEVERSKNKNATIDAFVALGGNVSSNTRQSLTVLQPDQSGKISLDKLRATLQVRT